MKKYKHYIGMILFTLMIQIISCDVVKLPSLTISENVYKDVIIEKVSDTEARITHSTGIKRIQLNTLSTDILKQLNVDVSDLNNALLKKQQEENIRMNRIKDLKNSTTNTLWVESIIPEGIICGYMEIIRHISSSSMGEIGGGNKPFVGTTLKKSYDNFIFLENNDDLKKVVDGEILSLMIIKMETPFTYREKVYNRYRVVKIIRNK